MDFTTLKAFFMWCTIINGGLLIFSSIMVILLADFSYKMNHRFFSISREQFNVIVCSFIGLYKIFFIFFNLVPWLAMVITG